MAPRIKHETTLPVFLDTLKVGIGNQRLLKACELQLEEEVRPQPWSKEVVDRAHVEQLDVE